MSQLRADSSRDANNAIDGRQREHVDNETRVAGARAKNIREAWPKVVKSVGSFPAQICIVLYTEL